MSHKGMSDKARRGAHAAPRGRKDDDVKVDIEVDDDAATTAASAVEPDEVEDAPGSTTAPAAAAPEDAEAAHQRMVDAAIKAGEQAADDDLAQDVKALRSERDDLNRKLSDASDELEAAKSAASEATDRVTRIQADWENFRRRTTQERADEKSRAAEGLVSQVLPVIDDLERAITHASSSSDDDPNLSQFVDGVEAVRVKLVGVLTHEGVEEIDPVGTPFNPLEHQAVGRVEDASVYDETVHDVYQKGYRMGGKVIRPAMVTVTYGGAKRPDEESADAAPDQGATSDSGTDAGPGTSPDGDTKQ